MYNYNFDGLKRINKTIARKIYNDGGEVLFIPCLLNPLNKIYSLGIWESKDLWGQYDNFDNLVNHFEWYNCNNETGKYTAFYIKA